MAVQDTEEGPAPRTLMHTPVVADPAALGLAGFALTTFLLSAKNAGWTHGGDAWLGFALFYGGLAQFMAGMMEFRNKNTFGAAAFGTYGAWWMSMFAYVHFAAASSTNVNNDLGWILLAIAIFNTYMMFWSTKTNTAVFLVFLTLEITEIVLFIGFFANSTSIIKIGGVIGVITALVAWYTSAAVVVNSMSEKPVLSVGKPMW